MDFKFDVRILIISLFIHFAGYLLLSFYTQKPAPQGQYIDVVINTNKPKYQTVDTSKIKAPSEDEKPDVDLTATNLVSNKKIRFKKQTSSNLYGKLQNKTSKGEKQESVNVQDTPTTESSNFLLSGNNAAEQEVQNSTVPFRATNVSHGEMTFLNSDLSMYASFFLRIAPKISFNWSNNVDDIVFFPHVREKLVHKTKWTTLIEWTIDKNGKFIDSVIVNSSGLPELDHTVRDAVRQAGPYINPPSGIVKKNGLVVLKAQFSFYTVRPRFANPN